MVSFRDSVPLCNKTNCDRLEPDSGADFAAASMAASSSSHADSEALYYHHDDSLPTDLEPNYNLQALPLAGLTAASAQCGNLFPTPQDTPYFYIKFSGVGVASVHAMQHCDSIGYGFWVGFFWNS